MEKEEIGLSLKVDASNGNKTIKDLKNEIKEINNQLLNTEKGSTAYAKLASEAAKAKAELKDIREDVQALDPENLGRSFVGMGQSIAGGFAAAQGAMALFGAESEEIQKTLLKVQASIAIVEGIKAATEGWAAAQRALNVIMAANPFLLAAAAIALVTAAVVAYTNSTDDATTKTEAYTKSLDDLRKTNENLKNEYDDLIISINEANGVITSDQAKYLKNQTKFNAERKKLQEDYEKGKEETRKQYDDKIKEAEKEGNREEKKRLEKEQSDALEQMGINHRRNLNQLEDNFNKKIELEDAIENKAERERARKDAERFAKEQKEFWDKVKFRVSDYIEAESIIIQSQEEIEAKAQAERERIDIASQLAEQERQDSREKYWKEKRQEEIEQERLMYDTKLSIASSYAQSISNVFQLIGGQSQEMINLQKALTLMQIGIDTAGAISALTRISFSPTSADNLVNPLAPYLKIATGIATITANMVRAKQLLSSGGGSAPNISTPNFNTRTSTPTINAGDGASGGGTNITTGANGNVQSLENTVIKAYVVESDITNSQKKIKSIKNKAKFG